MSPAVRASGVGALTFRVDPPSGLDAFRSCGSAGGRASASLHCSSTGMTARSTKVFPACFRRAYLTDPAFDAQQKRGRVPVAIKQARCLPPNSRAKLFVLNRLIPGSWNSPNALVTKRYVFSRGVVADKPCEPALEIRNPPVFGREALYFGCSVTLVMLTVPPSVACIVRFTCW